MALSVWFGETTTRWPVVQIRRVAHMGTGHTPDRSNEEYWKDCTIPWVTVSDIHGLGDRLAPLMQTEQHISELGLRNSAAVLHPPGTVMLSRTASIGHSCVIGRPMATTQAFVTWTPGADLDSRFLLASLKALRPELDARAYGSTHMTIYFPDVENLKIPLPPVGEQRAIADFLDRETARIDALIEKRTRLVGLIEERNRVAAHMSVLGGRRVPVWLKASGSPDVPKGWTSPLLQRVARVHMGTSFPHEFQGEASGDLPFVKVADLGNTDSHGTLLPPENWISRDVAKRLGARVLPADAILYARVGAALLLNPRARTPWPCVVDDNVRGLEFVTGLPAYWFFLLRLIDLGEVANPGIVPSVSEGQVTGLRVPLPPIDAQRSICEEVQRNESEALRMLLPLRGQLGLLKERRQALITAAVTGQLGIPAAA